MKKTYALQTISLTIATIAIVALAPLTMAQDSRRQGGGPWCCDMWNPGWMQRDMWRRDHMGPMHRSRMARHRTFMHQGLPEAYRNARNPLPITEDVVRAGAKLYADNCASCHGARGMGDGEAGKGLNPSPALLAHLIQMPMAVDSYLLWSISDGGAEFKTGMPAFKDVLTKQEIWKIVAYMRAGFPQSNVVK
ncbi:MAG: c-type cytochrome [Hyphomicrobiaceae bacterium]